MFMDCPRVRAWTSGMILLELQVRVISAHWPLGQSINLDSAQK